MDITFEKIKKEAEKLGVTICSVEYKNDELFEIWLLSPSKCADGIEGYPNAFSKDGPVVAGYDGWFSDGNFETSFHVSEEDDWDECESEQNLLEKVWDELKFIQREFYLPYKYSKRNYPKEFNKYFKSCRSLNKDKLKHIIWNAWRDGYNTENPNHRKSGDINEKI